MAIRLSNYLIIAWIDAVNIYDGISFRLKKEFRIKLHWFVLNTGMFKLARIFVKQTADLF